MKRIIFVCLVSSISLLLNAQIKEGTVNYQRVSKMEIKLNISGLENLVPKERKDFFELSFGNNQSLWKAAPQEEDDGATSSENGGLQIKMFVSGNNDVLYYNFNSAKKVEKRELFDKTFIIEDSIRPNKWKMEGETRVILNHTCMKATTTEIGKSSKMVMNNGNIERKEVTDTSNVVAWVATDIPVPAGPSHYQGELPGLILEISTNNGQFVYTATSIKEKADLSVIKEPSGKKRLTPEEYRKESDKMFKDMQQNMGGGTRRVIMN